eukprot:6176354-Pleurochrysis_carterae.AAC.1
MRVRARAQACERRGAAPRDEPHDELLEWNLDEDEDEGAHGGGEERAGDAVVHSVEEAPENAEPNGALKNACVRAVVASTRRARWVREVL